MTTTLDGLRSGLAKAGRLDTGLALSAAALRMLACDGLVVPAVLGTDSEVLDLGRAQRDFNRAQRRATALRDRGCVAPGCDQPPRPATCTTCGGGPWADPPTWPTQPCCASSITGWSTAKAGR